MGKINRSIKDVLLDIIDNDTTYNKSATRYLYKTHPDLWKEILDITSFLPVNAFPKQRVWHILNNVWEIPTCPVTGENVNWFENRYLKTKDRTSKTKLQHSRGDFKNNYSSEINKKRKASNLEAVKRGRQYRDKKSYSPESYEKAKKDLYRKVWSR